MAERTARRPARPRPADLPRPSARAVAAASATASASASATADHAATAGRTAPTAPIAPAGRTAHAGRAAPADRAALLDRAGRTLVELLDRQSAVHARLVEHLESTRAAIRRADVEAVAACCRAEQALLAEIEALEARRREVVDGLTGVLAPGRPEPLPLSEITPHLPAATGERLQELRGGLRRSLEEAARLSAVVTGAAEAVGTHLAGLVQTLGSALAGPGTYGRRGRVDDRANAPLRLDLTS